MSNWQETRKAFCHLAAREGVARIAARIPANRATVYRIIKGTTGLPCEAVRTGIEKIIKEKKQ